MPGSDPIGTYSVPLELAVGAGLCAPFHGGAFLAGMVSPFKGSRKSRTRTPPNEFCPFYVTGTCENLARA